MKALQITQPGEIRLIDVAIPEIKPEEVLVKINYVGFCGSDLNTYRGKNPMAQLPVIPGHEIGATIVKIGAGVPPVIREQMPCTVMPYSSCGKCPACRNGRPNACQYNQTFGVQRNGAMTEYLSVPWEKVIIDPENKISSKYFALVEPLSIGVHAIARAEVTESDFVLIAGCGMIGIGALARAVATGAKVIAMDLEDQKLALAKRLGAAYTVNTMTENVHDRLQAITNQYGPDVVIEAVGVPSTYQIAVNEAAFTGRVVCLGFAKTEIALETKHFVQKELDIRGSRNASPDDFRVAMEYMKKGIYPLDELISGIYKPEEAQAVMENWSANPGKIFKLIIEF